MARATHGSGGAFKVSNGAQGYRKGQTNLNADGSASHTGSLAVSGKNGSVTNSNSMTKSSDGQVNGQSTTTLTGKNGNSETVTKTDTNGQVTKTKTCKDANANAIVCK